MDRMDKNRFRQTGGSLKRLLCAVCCLVLFTASLHVCAFIPDAAMAWPSMSSSKPVRSYTASTDRKYPVYDKNHKKISGIRLSNSNYIYITGVTGSWAQIRYKHNGKKKTGYVPLNTFTSVTAPKSVTTARTSVTAYRRSAGDKTTDKVAKGSTLYTMTASGSRVQVIYSVKNSSGSSKGWRMAWVRSSDYTKLTSAKAESTLQISGVSRPGTLVQGSPFSVTGSVTSNYRISQVTVEIRDSNNNLVSGRTAVPNSNSFSLSVLDPYILFNKAKAGTNYYRITAKDEKKTVNFNCAFSVIASAPGSASPDKKEGGSSYFLGYTGYSGVNYKSQTGDKHRISALNKAKQMVTVKWKSPMSFPAWYNSEGYYSTTKATDGTTSVQFLKGKTYVGIPYSMVNHSYDDSAWKNLIKGGFSWNQIAASYYSYSNKTTAKGTDCSYFVYLCMRAAGANVTYQTTYMMYNGKYYKGISKSSLKPGDILLTSSHVRLYAGRVGSKYAVFESTGDGSKTRYKLFSQSELSSYAAYRYKYW